MGNVIARADAEAIGVDEDRSTHARSDGGSAVFLDGDYAPTSLRKQSSVEYMENSPPASSPSPLLFTPQPPVPSLQGTDAVSPMMNLMSRTEPPTSLIESPPQGQIPTLITWCHGGDNVAVEGSWDNWASRKVLQRAGKDHSILLVLPSGIFHYRFIVDGFVKQSPDLPFVSDELGEVAHVLDVHDYVPEALDGVSQFEVPDSPDSSYDQELIEEDDLSKDPVRVPSPLHKSVLQNPKAEEGCSSKPQHVVLNHLYMDRDWDSESVMALGMTHRFESKYVTVVLYKPRPIKRYIIDIYTPSPLSHSSRRFKARKHSPNRRKHSALTLDSTAVESYRRSP